MLVGIFNDCYFSASLSYAVGEKFLKPFLKEMMKAIKTMDIDIKEIDMEALVGSIPMSHQTMAKRCVEVAKDLDEQTCIGLKASKIGHAFQSDASKDIESKEQLVAFVR